MATEKPVPPLTLPDVIQFDFVQRNFRQGLGDELDNVIIVDNLVDITLIVRTGKDNDLAFILHQFTKLIEFVQEHKSIDNGHINIQKNNVRKVIGDILVFFQIIQGALAGALYLHSPCEFGDLDNPFADEIISVVIVYQHDQFYRLCSCIHQHSTIYINPSKSPFTIQVRKIIFFRQKGNSLTMFLLST